jgi:hypothetical protein
MCFLIKSAISSMNFAVFLRTSYVRFGRLKRERVMKGFESCKFLTMSASVWLFAVAVNAIIGTYGILAYMKE